jgi:hypothetical protein
LRSQPYQQPHIPEEDAQNAPVPEGCAYIGIDFLDKKTEIIKLKTPEDAGLFTLDIETNSGKKTIAIDNPEVKQSNAIRMELELFRDSILQNKPVAVNVIDGLQALDVAHQILQKISRNQSAPAS